MADMETAGNQKEGHCHLRFLGRPQCRDEQRSQDGLRLLNNVPVVPTV